LKQAQDAYDKAKDNYDKNFTVPEWAMDYELTTAQLALAQTKLEQAEDDLAEMQAGPDPLQVALAQKNLESAQANLVKTEDQLAGITGDATTLEGQLKQIQIAEAKAALDVAEEQLGKVVVVAPFDGVVTALNVEAGQSVNASTVVAEITDPSVIDLSASLDEIDVPQVSIGQKATVTLDSLSDLELSAVVSSISSTSRNQSGVVSYTVTIRVTPPESVQLREGMSATADIIFEESDNVLVVPAQAILSAGNNSYVEVLVNGEIQQKVVELGISDGSYTEVKSGLMAGEQVIMQTTSSTSSTTQQNTRNNRTFPGGIEFPGGGGGIIIQGGP
jgi:RND family efflux transporter MFP subunit